MRGIGVLALAMAALAPATAAALTVTDQTGRPATLAAPPRASVSWFPA